MKSKIYSLLALILFLTNANLLLSQLKNPLNCGELHVITNGSTNFLIEAVPVGVGWDSRMTGYTLISVPYEYDYHNLILDHIDRIPQCGNPNLYYAKYDIKIGGLHKVYVDYRRCFSGSVAGDIDITYDNNGNIVTTSPNPRYGVIYTFDEPNPDRSCFLIPITVQNSFSEGVVRIDEVEYDAPYNSNWSLSSQHFVQAISPQIVNNYYYEFSSWSDGGAIDHNYIVDGQSSSINLVANFTTRFYAYITGPGYLKPGQIGQYTANTTSGTPPYQYTWYLRYDCGGVASIGSEKNTINYPCDQWILLQQTQQTVNIQAYTNFTLKVIVTDYYGHTAEAIKSVSTSPNPKISNKDSYSINSEREYSEINKKSENIISYPNPFNPSTTIEYNLKENEKINISVYDIIGRKIKTLVSEERSAGIYKVIWDGKDESGNLVSSGIYICRITGKNMNENHKLFLQK